MARYIEGQEAPLAQSASDGMLMFTASLAVLIGFILFVLGRKGKQMWMWVWGIGLIIVASYMGIATALGSWNILAWFS